MASSIQLLRSTISQERPFPGNLLEGQPAVNLNSTEPGLFFKAADGSLVKIGPAAITSDGSPPNSSPQGSSGNSVGELWLDKSTDPAVLKVYDGANWVDAGSGGGGDPAVVSLQRWVKTANGGETTVSGLDNSSQTLSYTPGLEEVFLNGVLLTRGVDYAASNGDSIVFISALAQDDEVTVLGWKPFNVLGPIDAADISFTQADSGAVDRTVKDKLKETVSVEDFGADPTGSTDSTSSILSAVNAINSGGTLYVPKGTYKLTSQITATIRGPVQIICDPDSVFDATTSPDFPGFRFRGTFGSTKSLSASVETGDTSITLANVSDLSAGDWIVIQSTTNFVPETNENLGSGEFAKIASINGTTLTLSAGLNYSYSSSTTTAAKFNGHPISITNLRIKRDLDNSLGIDIYAMRDVTLTNCEVSGAKERSIWLRACCNATVTNCKTIADYTPSVSTNYGLSIDSCQNVAVNGGYFRAGRHGVKMGVTSSDKVTCRYIRVNGATVCNTFDPSPTWALDCHDPADHVTVSSCTVTNGIGIQAKNCIITGNTVLHGSEVNAYNTMIYWWPYSPGGSAVISDNTLIQTGGGIVNGIRLSIGVSTISNLTVNSLVVKNNSLFNVSTAFYVTPWEAPNSKIKSLVFSGNTIIDSSSYAIRILTSADQVSRIIDSLLISDNYVEGKVEMYHAGSITRLISNTFLGLNSANRINIYCSGDVDVLNNSISKFTSSNGLLVDGRYTETINISGNSQTDNSGSTAVGFPKKKIISGSSFIGAYGVSSSEPRYGLWTVNDIIFDVTPTPGSYIGWICSTAGYGISGPWTTGTFYSAGQQVTNAGNLYRCIISGTSGTTAPTHTSGEESDGGVTWEFISNSFAIAVFKQFGSILA